MIEIKERVRMRPGRKMRKNPSARRNFLDRFKNLFKKHSHKNENSRRVRQIKKGQLTISNGLCFNL